MRAAQRPAAELRGLGAKKKCQRSWRAPVTRCNITRALSASPGANRARAGAYTGVLFTPASADRLPRATMIVALWRRRWLATSRTKFLLLSFHGGATGFETMSIRAIGPAAYTRGPL